MAQKIYLESSHNFYEENILCKVWLLLEVTSLRMKLWAVETLFSSKLNSPVIKTLKRHSLNVKKLSLRCFDYRRI